MPCKNIHMVNTSKEEKVKSKIDRVKAYFQYTDAMSDDTVTKYFVKPSIFDKITDLKRCAIFAPAGGGKTACLKKISFEIEPFKNAFGKNILCASYDNFNDVKSKAGEEISASDHADAIIRSALRSLIRNISKRPGLVDEFNIDIKPLIPYVSEYKDCITEEEINSALRGAGIDINNIQFAVLNHQIGYLLLKSGIKYIIRT